MKMKFMKKLSSFFLCMMLIMAMALSTTGCSDDKKENYEAMETALDCVLILASRYKAIVDKKLSNNEISPDAARALKDKIRDNKLTDDEKKNLSVIDKPFTIKQKKLIKTFVDGEEFVFGNIKVNAVTRFTAVALFANTHDVLDHVINVKWYACCYEGWLFLVKDVNCKKRCFCKR